MTQIVAWMARNLQALVTPKSPDLPPEVTVTIGDARRLNDVLLPPIRDYLNAQGYDETLAGCGFRENKFCVIVTLSKAPEEEEVMKLAELAAPFPLAIEVEPRLRELCEEIISAMKSLGLAVEIVEPANPPAVESD